MIDDEARADYREVFGKDPEPWRLPLGALRLTLAGDAPWTLERARSECEELVRVLNEVEVTDVRVEAAEAVVVPAECDHEFTDHCVFCGVDAHEWFNHDAKVRP